MLDFDKDFFLGETRNDFYIEPMIKCAWAAELEVLEVVRNICEKHNLKYFAADGTLLGAVRHRGFIPWDDDIDIMMPRDDYMLFLSVAPTELTGEYCIHSPYNTPNHKTVFSTITNASSISYSPQRLLAFHGFPYVAVIDIMPLDLLPSDPGEREAFFELFNILVSCILNYDRGEIDGIMELLPALEETCNTQIDRDGNIPQQLRILADHLSQSYNASDSPYISCIAAYAAPPKKILLKEWYADCIWMPFENIQVPAPIGYDEILTTLWGDYMTPVQYASHEYPFYKKQNEEMIQKLSERIIRGKALWDTID